MTLDADIAVPEHLPVRRQDIRQRLISSGFSEEFLSTDRPPATHYYLGGAPSGFYVEFLTPLVGSEYDRNNRRKATLGGGWSDIATIEIHRPALATSLDN